MAQPRHSPALDGAQLLNTASWDRIFALERDFAALREQAPDGEIQSKVLSGQAAGLMGLALLYMEEATAMMSPPAAAALATFVNGLAQAFKNMAAEQIAQARPPLIVLPDQDG